MLSYIPFVPLHPNFPPLPAPAPASTKLTYGPLPGDFSREDGTLRGGLVSEDSPFADPFLGQLLDCPVGACRTTVKRSLVWVPDGVNRLIVPDRCLIETVERRDREFQSEGLLPDDIDAIIVEFVSVRPELKPERWVDEMSDSPLVTKSLNLTAPGDTYGDTAPLPRTRDGFRRCCGVAEIVKGLGNLKKMRSDDAEGDDDDEKEEKATTARDEVEYLIWRWELGPNPWILGGGGGVGGGEEGGLSPPTLDGILDGCVAGFWIEKTENENGNGVGVGSESGNEREEEEREGEDETEVVEGQLTARLAVVRPHPLLLTKRLIRRSTEPPKGDEWLPKNDIEKSKFEEEEGDVFDEIDIEFIPYVVRVKVLCPTHKLSIVHRSEDTNRMNAVFFPHLLGKGDEIPPSAASQVSSPAHPNSNPNPSLKKKEKNRTDRPAKWDCVWSAAQYIREIRPSWVTPPCFFPIAIPSSDVFPLTYMRACLNTLHYANLQKRPIDLYGTAFPDPELLLGNALAVAVTQHDKLFPNQYFRGNTWRPRPPERYKSWKSVPSLRYGYGTHRIRKVVSELKSRRRDWYLDNLSSLWYFRSASTLVTQVASLIDTEILMDVLSPTRRVLRKKNLVGLLSPLFPEVEQNGGPGVLCDIFGFLPIDCLLRNVRFVCRYFWIAAHSGFMSRKFSLSEIQALLLTWPDPLFDANELSRDPDNTIILFGGVLPPRLFTQMLRENPYFRDALLGMEMVTGPPDGGMDCVSQRVLREIPRVQDDEEEEGEEEEEEEEKEVPQQVFHRMIYEARFDEHRTVLKGVLSPTQPGGLCPCSLWRDQFFSRGLRDPVLLRMLLQPWIEFCHQVREIRMKQAEEEYDLEFDVMAKHLPILFIRTGESLKEPVVGACKYLSIPSQHPYHQFDLIRDRRTQYSPQSIVTPCGVFASIFDHISSIQSASSASFLAPLADLYDFIHREMGLDVYRNQLGSVNARWSFYKRLSLKEDRRIWGSRLLKLTFGRSRQELMRRLFKDFITKLDVDALRSLLSSLGGNSDDDGTGESLTIKEMVDMPVWATEMCMNQLMSSKRIKEWELAGIDWVGKHVELYDAFWTCAVEGTNVLGAVALQEVLSALRKFPDRFFGPPRREREFRQKNRKFVRRLGYSVAREESLRLTLRRTLTRFIPSLPDECLPRFCDLIPRLIRDQFVHLEFATLVNEEDWKQTHNEGDPDLEEVRLCCPNRAYFAFLSFMLSLPNVDAITGTEREAFLMAIVLGDTDAVKRFLSLDPWSRRRSSEPEIGEAAFPLFVAVAKTLLRDGLGDSVLFLRESVVVARGILRLFLDCKIERKVLMEASDLILRNLNLRNLCLESRLALSDFVVVLPVSFPAGFEIELRLLSTGDEIDKILQRQRGVSRVFSSHPDLMVRLVKRAHDIGGEALLSRVFEQLSSQLLRDRWAEILAFFLSEPVWSSSEDTTMRTIMKDFLRYLSNERGGLPMSCLSSSHGRKVLSRICQIGDHVLIRAFCGCLKPSTIDDSFFSEVPVQESLLPSLSAVFRYKWATKPSYLRHFLLGAIRSSDVSCVSFLLDQSVTLKLLKTQKKKKTHRRSRFLATTPDDPESDPFDPVIELWSEIFENLHGLFCRCTEVSEESRALERRRQRWIRLIRKKSSAIETFEDAPPLPPYEDSKAAAGVQHPYPSKEECDRRGIQILRLVLLHIPDSVTIRQIAVKRLALVHADACLLLLESISFDRDWLDEVLTECGIPVSKVFVGLHVHNNPRKVLLSEQFLQKLSAGDCSVPLSRSSVNCLLEWVVRDPTCSLRDLEVLLSHLKTGYLLHGVSRILIRTLWELGESTQFRLELNAHLVGFVRRSRFGQVPIVSPMKCRTAARMMIAFNLALNGTE